MRIPLISPYAGWDLVLLFLLCGGLAVGLGIVHWALAIPPAVVFLGVLFFFRDPPRRIPTQHDVLVAPADGRVTDIEEVEEADYIRGRALRIGIFLSPLNVHVNRSPCDARVEYLVRRKGMHLPAYNPKAPARNVQTRIGLRETRHNGGPILVAQIVGKVARRIVCPVSEGTELARGQRFGMIRFGSRTELYVPVDAGFVAHVAVGDRVRGGTTIMGMFRTGDTDAEAPPEETTSRP